MGGQYIPPSKTADKLIKNALAFVDASKHTFNDTDYRFTAKTIVGRMIVTYQVADIDDEDE